MTFFHANPRPPFRYNETPIERGRTRESVPPMDGGTPMGNCRGERTTPMDGGTSMGNCRGERPTPMDRDKLLRYIQELSFVKVELELYLNAYPDCTAALHYYYEIVGKLAEATRAYESEFGPLTAAGVQGDRWTWVEGKWPWQMDEWR